MDKKRMLEELISFYTDGNKAQFACMIGVKPQVISAWIARNTFDNELLYANCKNLSADWLLSGEGSMIRGNLQNVDIPDEDLKTTIIRLQAENDVLREVVGLSKKGK